jgi:hypothetical protein
MRNKPNIDALMEGGQIIPVLRQLVDYLIQNPSIADDERKEGLKLIDEGGKALRNLLDKPGVNENSRIYVRLWIEFAGTAHDFYKAAPFNLSDPSDRARFEQYRSRDDAMKEKANRHSAANPQPSFWRIFFLGNVNVRSIN